jgi:intein/homing endonuclease
MYDTEAIKFYKEIGMTAKDKSENMERWLDFEVNERRIIPILRKEIWDLIKGENLFPSHFMKFKKDKHITLEKLKLILNKLKFVKIKNSNTLKKLEFINNLIFSNISWSKVKTINKIQTKEILYDISIPGQQNYIANGFLVHNSTYRVYLRRGKKDTRVAKMIDAPNIPEIEIIFKITEKGIEDSS